MKRIEVKKGLVIWLTGISGAGKTTLALSLNDNLKKKGIIPELLDGDIVRSFFENDLGYSRHERIQNVRRITFAAKLLSDRGICVVVANIAPYVEVRDFIRSKIPSYCQVYVKVSQSEVIKRDVKDLYKQYQEGDLVNLISMDDQYEVPRNPDIMIDTDVENVEESTKKLLKFLEVNNKV